MKGMTSTDSLLLRVSTWEVDRPTAMSISPDSRAMPRVVSSAMVRMMRFLNSGSSPQYSSLRSSTTRSPAIHSTNL